MTIGKLIAVLADACGGIPVTCMMHGTIVASWSAEDDGRDRHAIDLAVRQWALRCALHAFGDAVRRIAKQTAAEPPRLDS